MNRSDRIRRHICFGYLPVEDIGWWRSRWYRHVTWPKHLRRWHA